MNRITIAVLMLSTAVGCGTSRSATGGRAEREGNGTVTGIISLADEVGPKTGDYCEGLAVKVAYADAPEDVLGSRMVKVSRGRCSYQVTGLPSDGPELQLTVAPSPAWKCANAGTPTLKPEQQTLKLKDYQAETRDFRVTCETSAAEAAQ
ncbi:hypothetical protein F0U61_50865 [Archangium violaceum]|uniref:hypothetical protein n=1 Tax=Archangium violaceum TaxID=83451 RepID=UPI002B2B8904|nr:hypothetical protein F0U61_50865 [Archangium violaceum]